MMVFSHLLGISIFACCMGMSPPYTQFTTNPYSSTTWDGFCMGLAPGFTVLDALWRLFGHLMPARRAARGPSSMARRAPVGTPGGSVDRSASSARVVDRWSGWWIRGGAETQGRLWRYRIPPPDRIGTSSSYGGLMNEESDLIEEDSPLVSMVGEPGHRVLPLLCRIQTCFYLPPNSNPRDGPHAVSSGASGGLHFRGLTRQMTVCPSVHSELQYLYAKGRSHPV